MLICDYCKKRISPVQLEYENDFMIRLRGIKAGMLTIRFQTMFENGYFLHKDCLINIFGEFFLKNKKKIFKSRKMKVEKICIY